MKFGILTLYTDRMDQPISNINLLNPKSLIDPVKTIEQAIKRGFRNFEITYDIDTMIPGIFDQHKIKELLDLKMKHNLTYSVHLPLWSVELACPHPYIRDAGKNMMIDAINTMKALDPEVYVLHATGALVAEFLRMKLPPFFDGFLARYMLKYSFEAIEQILVSTNIPSRKIAVECIEFPFEFMDELIEKFDLSVCMDVGHLIAGYSGNISIEHFVEKYFNRLTEIHLHDAFRKRNGDKFDVADHLPLGKGTLDFKWLLAKLLDKGYDKRVVFELSLKESLESLEKLSEHFSIDLKSNSIRQYTADRL